MWSWSEHTQFYQLRCAVDSTREYSSITAKFRICEIYGICCWTRKHILRSWFDDINLPSYPSPTLTLKLKLRHPCYYRWSIRFMHAWKISHSQSLLPGVSGTRPLNAETEKISRLLIFTLPEKKCPPGSNCLATPPVFCYDEYIEICRWNDSQGKRGHHATFIDLDHYLQTIRLECCGHLSRFSVGG